MLEAQIIGWIGNIGFILGAILIAHKNKNGLYAFSLGNICYVIQGVILSNLSLLTISFVLLLLNVYGIYKWSNYKRKKEKIMKEIKILKLNGKGNGFCVKNCKSKREKEYLIRKVLGASRVYRVFNKARKCTKTKPIIIK